ncbi:MAG TPA: porin family protein [Devosia sp.]|nr:porin family protein [Devosia sp.]
MRLFMGMIIAAGASAALVGPGFGAESITIPTSTPSQLPLHDITGFDWNGFYTGIFAGGNVDQSGEAGLGLGIQAGVNAQFDFYLVGAEITVQGLPGDGGTNTYGQVLGRAGLVVTDDVVVYAAGGYGLTLDGTQNSDLLVGGGVELAITDELSIRAQYVHGVPLDGGNEKNQFTLGASFHF